MSPFGKTHNRGLHISLPTKLESSTGFVEDRILTSQRPSWKPLATTVFPGSDGCALLQETPACVLQTGV